MSLNDRTWENVKRFQQVNKIWLYTFGVVSYCMQKLQLGLELVV